VMPDPDNSTISGSDLQLATSQNFKTVENSTYFVLKFSFFSNSIFKKQTHCPDNYQAFPYEVGSGTSNKLRV
jgi:hypothetical protein